MTIKIKIYLISIISICINASAQNLIHLNCTGALTSKFKSGDFRNTAATSTTQTNGSVAINLNNGSVIEGTVAEGIIKVPSFTSTVSDARFRGQINSSNNNEKQKNESNGHHIIWYYSFDRYTGNYKVKHVYKTPPMRRDGTSWDEWDYEEIGTCTELSQRKF